MLAWHVYEIVIKTINSNSSLPEWILDRSEQSNSNKIRRKRKFDAIDETGMKNISSNVAFE